MSTFYDDFSRFYHLIFDDWNKSIDRQSVQLSSVIESHWPQSKSILDLSCGIGTQTLSLAQRGYELTGSDLSPKEIDRARREAKQRALERIQFSVCDMRTAHAHHQRTFDVVICCDNSLPHLLTDDDIRLALREMFLSLRPGGGCLLTTRDYDHEDRSTRNLVKPYGTAKIENGRRYVSLQVWDFDPSDPRFYDFTLYIIEEDLSTKEIVTHAMRSRYYAITSTRLMQLMAEAGFERIQRLNDAFYQPVYIATKPSN